MTFPGPGRPVKRAMVVGIVLAVVPSSLLSSCRLSGDDDSPAGSSTDVGSWQTIDTFDDYLVGSLRTQGAWQVNTPGAADGALATDQPPAWMSGKALLVQPSTGEGEVRYRGDAYASLGEHAVAEGATATLFLEVATTTLAATDLHLGLSADDSPGLGMDTTGDDYDLDDFGPEVTLGAEGLVARDGAEDRVLEGTSMGDDGAYRLWLVVDNANDTYSVYAASRGHDDPVRLHAGDQDTFAFRSPSSAPLGTLLLLNDEQEPPAANTYLDTFMIVPGSQLSDPSPHFVTGWSDPELIAGGRDLDHDIPAIERGSTGTVFWRMRRTGPAALSVGLGEDGGDVDEMRTALRSSATGGLEARDGSSFREAATWRAGGWQCMWLVADNESGTARLYARGGRYAAVTRLPTRGDTDFAFRLGTGGALDRLEIANGAGTVQIDDVAVDPTHADLRIPGSDVSLCPYSGSARNVPVSDPAPTLAQPSRLALDLTTFAQLPPADKAHDGPLRRANSVLPFPGGTRLAVPALEGPLYTLSADGRHRETYLDLAEEFPDFVFAPGLGTGFGYVAFAPDFARTGRFYTVHTEAGSGLKRATTFPEPRKTSVHGVLTEWTAKDPSAPVFAGTHREVMRIGFTTYLHGIQEISFDPLARPGDADYGLLYLGIGDGDSTPHFSDAPQDRNDPHGKILRIDPRQHGSAPYTVPASNPLVHATYGLGEVYAVGLRNPHRFAWDPADGAMFVGNIGEKRVDSIYRVHPGANFGWNAREGGYRFEKTHPDDVYPLPPDDTGFTYPVIQIGRRAGTSLALGPVYSGGPLTALDGHLLWGDIVSGQISETSAGLLQQGLPQAAFHTVDLTIDGSPTKLTDLTGGSRVDFRFGQDDDGGLFVLSKQLGTIWRVSAARTLGTTPAACRPSGDTLVPEATTADWEPQSPPLWRFGGPDDAHNTVALTRAGREPSGPVRPRAFAVVRAGGPLTDFELSAQVRVGEPTSTPGRDVVLLFSYASPTSFAYAHLASDVSYAHTGLFVVDDADRRRFDDQFDGADLPRSPRPAITDGDWHDVVVRHCGDSGATEVAVDGTTLLTGTDTALASGLVGFGSFDGYGDIRDVRITGH